MYLGDATCTCVVHTHTHTCIFSAVVGEVDEEMEAEINLSEIRAEPLNPVIH